MISGSPFQPTYCVLLTCPQNFLSFNTLWYSKIVYIHLVFSLLQYWGFFGWGGVSGSFGDTHIPFFGELAKLLKSLASLYTIFLTETSFWARLSLLILLYILRYSKNSEKPTVYGDWQYIQITMQKVDGK